MFPFFDLFFFLSLIVILILVLFLFHIVFFLVNASKSINRNDCTPKVLCVKKKYKAPGSSSFCLFCEVHVYVSCDLFWASSCIENAKRTFSYYFP